MRRPSPTNKLRIASYNVHLGIGADGHFNPERIARVVGELNADVVALQEVQTGTATTFDMVEFLADQSNYAFTAKGGTMHGPHGAFGNALLSRVPIASVETHDLSVPGREPRGALDVHLARDRFLVRVVATHLGLRPAERRTQVRRLITACAETPHLLTILLGDLNEWLLWGRSLRWLRDHFALTPALPTFPARRPVFALDRIWVYPRDCLRGIQVHATPLARMASDHLPVKAVVVVGTAACVTANCVDSAPLTLLEGECP